jgi:hypothetical protein
MGELPATPDELLLRLVEADERTRPDRDHFILFRVMVSGQGLPVQHPGLEEDGLSAREQDLEDLADAGHLRLERRANAWHFDITPTGFERARKLRRASEPPPAASVGGGIGWSTAMLPVLLGVGNAYSATSRPEVGVTPAEVAETLGRDHDDELERILYELTRTDYVEAVLEVDQSLAPVSMRPTEKALRVVAGWPGGADALLAALAARRDAATSEEERGRLQRAYESLSGLGREVLSDVIANVLTGRF